jgi:hypothetical protein
MGGWYERDRRHMDRNVIGRYKLLMYKDIIYIYIYISYIYISIYILFDYVYIWVGGMNGIGGRGGRYMDVRKGEKNNHKGD